MNSYMTTFTFNSNKEIHLYKSSNMIEPEKLNNQFNKSGIAITKQINLYGDFGGYDIIEISYLGSNYCIKADWYTFMKLVNEKLIKKTKNKKLSFDLTLKDNFDALCNILHYYPVSHEINNKYTYLKSVDVRLMAVNITLPIREF